MFLHVFIVSFSHCPLPCALESQPGASFCQPPWQPCGWVFQLPNVGSGRVLCSWFFQPIHSRRPSQRPRRNDPTWSQCYRPDTQSTLCNIEIPTGNSSVFSLCGHDDRAARCLRCLSKKPLPQTRRLSHVTSAPDARHPRPPPGPRTKRLHVCHLLHVRVPRCSVRWVMHSGKQKSSHTQFQNKTLTISKTLYLDKPELLATPNPFHLQIEKKKGWTPHATPKKTVNAP